MKGLCEYSEPSEESSVSGTLTGRKPSTPPGSKGKSWGAVAVGRGPVHRIHGHK